MTPNDCMPITVYSGPFPCLDRDCDEYATEDGEPIDIDYCSHVSAQLVCEQHSEFHDGEMCTRAEPWPCQHAEGVSR